MFQMFQENPYRENKLQIQYNPIKILCVFLACFQKSGVHACVYFCLGHQLNSIDIHVCFCANTMLFWLLRFVVKLDVGDGDTSGSSFSIQVILVFLQFVCVYAFHMTLKIIHSRYVKNYVGILMVLYWICRLVLVG